MSDSAFKLQLLVRAELALMKIYTRRSMIGATAVAVALVFVLMGLGMLNYAAYLALLDHYTAGMAAFLVAIGDAVCAVAIIMLGSKLCCELPPILSFTRTATANPMNIVTSSHWKNEFEQR